MTHNGNNPYARSEIANWDAPRERWSWSDVWLCVVILVLALAIGIGGYWLVIQPLRGIWS